jgi:DNA gyrase inhibitor GyrI
MILLVLFFYITIDATQKYWNSIDHDRFQILWYMLASVWQWLPVNENELRNLPVYEKYCNDPARTEPEKLKTEVYIPIQ